MSSNPPYKLFTLGSRGIVAEFGNSISEEVNDFVIRLAGLLDSQAFEGYIECLPSYSSLAVFYDPVKVTRGLPEDTTASLFVSDWLEARIGSVPKLPATHPETLTIPVKFGGEHGPDLTIVAEKSGLSEEQVVEIFLSRDYRVFMLGFLPGFAYMGEVDPRIAVARRETPRKSVPKGSVGIAGAQTGIYPFHSPGGWQIIGFTETEMFSPDPAKLALLSPGDSVKFIRSSEN